MSDDQWLIGSAPHCDLIIDAPRVSAEHCRLTRHDLHYQLVDCGSTNGTFVEDRRVEGSVQVYPGQAISLGSSIDLPWPDSAAAKQIVLVGRDRENDVVIDAAEVSSLHARFLVGHDGTWLIEDLGSTNGVSVPLQGVPQRIRRAAAVLPEQSVYLGGQKIAVTDLLAAAAKKPARRRPVVPASQAPRTANLKKSSEMLVGSFEPSRPPTFTTPRDRVGLWYAIWFGLGTLLAFAFVLLILWLGDS